MGLCCCFRLPRQSQRNSSPPPRKAKRYRRRHRSESYSIHLPDRVSYLPPYIATPPPAYLPYLEPLDRPELLVPFEIEPSPLRSLPRLIPRPVQNFHVQRPILSRRPVEIHQQYFIDPPSQPDIRILPIEREVTTYTPFSEETLLSSPYIEEIPRRLPVVPTVPLFEPELQSRELPRISCPRLELQPLPPPVKLQLSCRGYPAERIVRSSRNSILLSEPVRELPRPQFQPVELHVAQVPPPPPTPVRPSLHLQPQLVVNNNIFQPPPPPPPPPPPLRRPDIHINTSLILRNPNPIPTDLNLYLYPILPVQIEYLPIEHIHIPIYLYTYIDPNLVLIPIELTPIFITPFILFEITPLFILELPILGFFILDPHILELDPEELEDLEEELENLPMRIMAYDPNPALSRSEVEQRELDAIQQHQTLVNSILSAYNNGNNPTHKDRSQHRNWYANKISHSNQNILSPSRGAGQDRALDENGNRVIFPDTSKDEGDDLIRRINLTAQLTNQSVSVWRSVYVEVHPKMTSDGTYPRGFERPVRLDEFLKVDVNTIDRLILAYNLPPKPPPHHAIPSLRMGLSRIYPQLPLKDNQANVDLRSTPLNDGKVDSEEKEFVKPLDRTNLRSKEHGRFGGAYSDMLGTENTRLPDNLIGRSKAMWIFDGDEEEEEKERDIGNGVGVGWIGDGNGVGNGKEDEKGNGLNENGNEDGNLRAKVLMVLEYLGVQVHAPTLLGGGFGSGLGAGLGGSSRLGQLGQLGGMRSSSSNLAGGEGLSPGVGAENNVIKSQVDRSQANFRLRNRIGGEDLRPGIGGEKGIESEIDRSEANFRLRNRTGDSGGLRVRLGALGEGMLGRGSNRSGNNNGSENLNGDGESLLARLQARGGGRRGLGNLG